MKHLLNFDTVAEYDAVKDNLEKPYVVTIDENNGLNYNTDVIRVPAGSGGGSTFTYFNVSETDYDIKYMISTFSLVAKVPQKIEIEFKRPGYSTTSTLSIPSGTYPSGLIAHPLGSLTEYDNLNNDYTRTLLQGVTAMGFDLSMKVPIEEQMIPLNDVLTLIGIKDYMDTLRITEEEFYTL